MTDTITLPTEPLGGGGLYDIDPDQGGMSQDSEAIALGDVEALPESLEL
jgi:hypothetical protein